MRAKKKKKCIDVYINWTEKQIQFSKVYRVSLSAHLSLLPQVRGLLEGGASRLEGLVQHLDAGVPQRDVLPASPPPPPHRQTSPLGLPASRPVGDRHVDEQAGVGQGVSRHAQQGHVAVAGLKALEGHAVLADEVVSDVVVV